VNLNLIDILRKYNSVLRGIDNYYSFVTNRGKMHTIQYLLHHSCAKLFSRKLKMHSRSRVFHKFGKDLKVFRQVGNKKEIYNFKLSSSYYVTREFNIN
jgi:hypothetical protein